MATHCIQQRCTVSVLILGVTVHLFRCSCRYEDIDDFEDAMDSSFHDFISRFPIVEIKAEEKVTGGHVFRVGASSSYLYRPL